ncbi:MAG: HAMP domain-containing histidine kinase [Gemmatimonadetes bacterium]|nr:HAMP domain-containing histidine kinase [Gemmatimonadota bacterium]
MSAHEAFRPGAEEILRQASIALGGRPVSMWEVAGSDRLLLQASSEYPPSYHATNIDVDATLKRWNVPLRHGSRWVGCRLSDDGPWVIAPVRARPPQPPPDGRERRSRERLTLELAGLCLGLVDRRENPRLSPQAAARTESLQELASLPAMIAHQASNPLTAARAGLQLCVKALGGWADLAADRRDELLDELGQVIGDIDRAISFLRAVQDRTRGAFARSERFDAVRVARSCITLETRLLHERSIHLDFMTTLDSAYLKGDPNSLFDLLVNLIRNAADAYQGLPGTVQVGLTREGTVLKLTVADQGSGILPEHIDRVFDSGFTTKEFGKGSGMGLALVRSVAEEVFAGSVSVWSQAGLGATFTVTLPIPPQRDSDPGIQRSAVGEEPSGTDG